MYISKPWGNNNYICFILLSCQSIIHISYQRNRIKWLSQYKDKTEIFILKLTGPGLSYLYLFMCIIILFAVWNVEITKTIYLCTGAVS